MAIEKIQSLDMMEKFYKALDDIDNLNTDFDTIKKKIDNKLQIINSCNAYAINSAENIKLSDPETSADRIIFNYHTNKIVDGNYNLYGQTLHSAFVKMPTNVFNFLTETGPIYKDNAIVQFFQKNNEDDVDYKYEYSNILKYESDSTKEDVFHVFDSDSITLAVQVNIGNLIGGTRFNMIELCPYLAGSFDIKEIRIFTVDQYLTQNMDIADKVITDTVKSVGAMRIALDKKYDLYRIEFDIKINYQLNGYPFGLRHLYFYETDSDTENDYVIIEVEKGDYIESVGDDIKILTPFNTLDTTASQYGIEYYLIYNENGTLQVPLTNPIARNVTKFYAKIPLKQPLIGIEFKNIKIR